MNYEDLKRDPAPNLTIQQQSEPKIPKKQSRHHTLVKKVPGALEFDKQVGRKEVPFSDLVFGKSETSAIKGQRPRSGHCNFRFADTLNPDHGKVK